MKRPALLLLACAPTAAPHAPADEAGALAALRAGCTGDAQQFCANVQPGGGRVIACLKEHKDELSDQCKQAAARAAQLSGDNAPGSAAGGMPGPASDGSAGLPSSSGFSSDSAGGSPSPPAPVPTPPAAASTTSGSHRSSSKAGNAAPGSYVLLKKVQITDPGSERPRGATGL
jgi:hypothetical protein